jgi:putative DNA primase/helicase
MMAGDLPPQDPEEWILWIRERLAREEDQKENEAKANGAALPPIIQVEAGWRHRAADEGLAAMYAAGVPFYQRDLGLVRVCRIRSKASDKSTILVPGTAPVRLPLLLRALGQSANWEKRDATGKPRRVDPPKEIAEQIAEMLDEWPFPPLVGIIACPTLRPDGSLLNEPGYDDATGLVLEKSIKMPPISKQPTKDDAIRALDLLSELLAEFPFRDDESKAVACSELITPVVRGAMPVAPMHHATSPEAASGKSYLADVAAMIATGERCPVLALSSQPEEGEKRLIGAALAGSPIIGIDNTRQVLQGDFLCQVTERPVMDLRSLGSSKLHRIHNSFTVLANGINSAVADDLVRRTLTSSLDANMEDPENRTFKADPLAMIRADRGKYIAACLTITIAYLTAGKPGRLSPLASYEGWSDLVRSPLVWLGCADPVTTIAEARKNDPIRTARRAVFAAWRESLETVLSYLTSEIVERARPTSTLHAALLGVAQAKNDPGKIDPIRLGLWLKKNENTVADRHKLLVDRSDAQRARWQLVEIV